LRLRPLAPQLQPSRLAVLTRELKTRATQPGAVLEVGCFRGGTAVYACTHMRRLDHPIDDYVAVDTFSGFVTEQFDADAELGTPVDFQRGFSNNSRGLVARTMRYYGLNEVRVVQGDIVTMPDELLPKQIKLCLMDVDLAVPIEVGLERVMPRLLPGGIVLVDDCDEDTPWRGARVGYERFCQAHDMREKYEAGFGVLSSTAKRELGFVK